MDFIEGLPNSKGKQVIYVVVELDVYKLDYKNLQNYAEKLSNYAENSIVQYQFSLSR